MSYVNGNAYYRGKTLVIQDFCDKWNGVGGGPPFILISGGKKCKIAFFPNCVFSCEQNTSCVCMQFFFQQFSEVESRKINGLQWMEGIQTHLASVDLSESRRNLTWPIPAKIKQKIITVWPPCESIEQFN